MSKTARSGLLQHVSLAAGLLVIAGTMLTWWGTGHEGYTRWPNAKLAAADTPASPAEVDLLADIGFDAEVEPDSPDIESRFAFGLLPGGFDSKHLASVATVGMLGVGLLAMSFVAQRRSTRAAEH